MLLALLARGTLVPLLSQRSLQQARSSATHNLHTGSEPFIYSALTHIKGQKRASLIDGLFYGP